MDIERQRKIDRWLGIPICRLLSLIPGPPPSAPPQDQPGRILVILLSEMGSLVLAEPMFRRLKDCFPEASIHVLVLERNREILEILGVVPPDNILAISDRSLCRFAVDSLRAIRRLRRIRVDTVMDCELFIRVSSIFSRLSGAGRRVGFHPHTQEGLYRGNFINRPVLYNPYHHISRQFLTLIEAIQSDTVPAAKRLPGAGEPPAPGPKEVPGDPAAMKARLHRDHPAVRDRRLILIHPSGGLLPIRAWPLDYYGRVAASLVEAGHAVAVIGLPGDKGLAEGIRARCRDPRCLDLTGYTPTIRELLALFALSSLLITSDGGPGHFSALMALPSIILYGPETPVLYGTLNRNAEHLFLSLPCSPCLTAYNHRHTPCDGDNRCLKLISPEHVLARATELLNRPH